MEDYGASGLVYSRTPSLKGGGSWVDRMNNSVAFDMGVGRRTFVRRRKGPEVDENLAFAGMEDIQWRWGLYWLGCLNEMFLIHRIYGSISLE